jgi:hypothetical protein
MREPKEGLTEPLKEEEGFNSPEVSSPDLEERLLVLVVAA